MAKSKRPKSSGSGHGEVTERTLSSSMIKKIKDGEPQFITIQGERKKVTPSNLHPNGKIKWYKRSDTKKIALCRPNVDRMKRAKYIPHSKKEPYSGDIKLGKKGGY